MSAAAPLRAAPARPAAPARSQPARPRLTLVAAPTAGRVPFVLAVGAVLAAGLVTLLLLHTLAAQDAFTVHQLQHRTASLSDQEQALVVANEQAQAPSGLAMRAAGLGMIPATSLTVTRLHGRAIAVLSAPPLPPPAPPPAQPSPAPSATAKASAKPAPASSSSTATAKPSPKPTATATHR
jgi:hypothetical protein